MRKGKILLDSYFKRNSLVEADVNSFNDFVDWRLQSLVDELGSPTPAVVPAETEEVKIEFGTYTNLVISFSFTEIFRLRRFQEC